MPYVLPGPSDDSPTPKDTSSPTTVDPKLLLVTTKTTPLERKELADYKEFAVAFKNHRIKLDYSHNDVSQQLGFRYGITTTKDSVSEFESLQMSLPDVRKLKSVLQMWVKDTAKAAGTSEEEINEIVVSPTTSINPRRERKRRTAIDPWVKEELEAEFQSKRKPTQVEMSRMASRLGVEKDFVRIWFCNRRQRQKKRDQELSRAVQRAGQSSTVEIAVPSTTVKIPSPSHEITIEVPSGESDSSAAVYITQGQYAMDTSSYN